MVKPNYKNPHKRAWIIIFIFSILTIAVFVNLTHFWKGRSSADISVSASPEIANGLRIHGTVLNPAALGPEDSEKIYQAIRKNISNEYFRSGDPVTSAYLNWNRYNTAPYRSSRHGDHFVNNYANEVARNYGFFERSGSFQVGSMIIKDSFIVTEHGNIISGPLFLMEKMNADFFPENGNWRYMMINPDGTIVGLSGTHSEDNVKFCAICHNTAPKTNDHMFYLPKSFRIVN